MADAEEMRRLHKARGWTQAEDEQLRHLMLALEGSEEALHGQDEDTEPIPGRSVKECLGRWRRLKGKELNVARHSGSWTAEEDRMLKELVSELGPKDWTKIQKRMNSTRDGKQCRERWHNHLNPQINKKPFTIEEDRLIAQYYQKFGSKWAEMARRLPGRTDNAIKNHFNTSLQRRQRQKSRGSIDSASNTSQSTSPPVSPKLSASSGVAASARFSPYQSQGRKRAGSAASSQTSPVFSHSPLRDRRANTNLNIAAEWLRTSGHIATFGASAGFQPSGPMTAPAESSNYQDFCWGSASTPPPPPIFFEDHGRPETHAATYYPPQPGMSASSSGEGPQVWTRAHELASVPLSQSYSSPGDLVQSQSSHSSSSSLSTPPQLSGLTLHASYKVPEPIMEHAGDVLAPRSSLPCDSTVPRPPQLQRTHSMPCYNPFETEEPMPFKSAYRDEFVSPTFLSSTESEDYMSHLSGFGSAGSAPGWSPYSLDTPTYLWEGSYASQDAAANDTFSGDVTLTDTNYNTFVPLPSPQHCPSMQSLSEALPSPPPLRHPQPQSHTQILNLDAFSPEASRAQQAGSFSATELRQNSIASSSASSRSSRANSLISESTAASFSPFPMSRSQSLSSSLANNPKSSSSANATPLASSYQHHRQRSSLSRDTMTDAAAQLRQNTSHYYTSAPA